jgi:hypothetical protein
LSVKSDKVEVSDINGLKISFDSSKIQSPIIPTLTLLISLGRVIKRSIRDIYFSSSEINSPIPIEHLKTIWKTFSEVNAQIKELNEKILSLKDYIDVLLSGVVTSEFVTKARYLRMVTLQRESRSKKEILSQL